jgi:hypothetical protein
MLEEVLSGARREGHLSRRWYTDANFDLYVWREAAHEICQFQLYWKRPAKLTDGDHIPEEAVTWSREGGVQLGQVADAGRYRTPILTGPSEIDLSEVITALRQHALPSGYPDVRFVLGKLSACAQETSREP